MEKFVPSEKDTNPEEKDNGYVVEDISSHNERNGADLPATNIIPTATDEQIRTVSLTTSSVSSSIDSSPRREDNHHYHNGSNAAGGGGEVKLQTKSPPLMSESERNPMANNCIAPLNSPRSKSIVSGTTRTLHEGNTIPSRFEKQTFGRTETKDLTSSSQDEQQESQQESDMIIALGPGCMIGKHCLDSLLHRPGAPEWKDEITQGTLNVGSVSSITAVVPSDSTDRVQVMSLSSYGYQKAIGNTMSNNGFERQVPLAEVAQNLKDDYTSTYVMQGESLIHQYILSTHPVNTTCQYTLSTYPVNTPCQHILSTHPINISCQYVLSIYPTNTFPLYALSIHPINTHYFIIHY